MTLKSRPRLVRAVSLQRAYVREVDLDERFGALKSKNSLKSFRFALSSVAWREPRSKFDSANLSSVANSVFGVDDGAALGVRRHDDQRDAEAGARLVPHGVWGDVIVVAAPVVPKDEDDGRVPELLLPMASMTLATHQGPQ